MQVTQAGLNRSRDRSNARQAPCSTMQRRNVMVRNIGRLAPHSAEVRERALRIARERGAEAASRATGVPAGTVRSWVRREAKRVEREQSSDGVVARLVREGRAMLRAERESAAAGTTHTGGVQPEPVPVSDALEPEQRRRGRRRTVKWGDEVVEAPEPVLEPEHEHEPEPERIESDEQRWRQLARLTGRGGAVSDGPPEARYDDATGLPWHERRGGRDER